MPNDDGPEKPATLYEQVEAVCRQRDELVIENKLLNGVVETLEGKVQRLQTELGGRYDDGRAV